MTTRTKGKYTSTRRQDGGWKVPTVTKMAIAVIGAFFILIGIVGSLLAHGQTNMTAGFGTNATSPAMPLTGPQNGALQQAKGCIGNDQTTGKTYLNVDCLRNFDTLRVICDNWPGGNATIPEAINCNPTTPYNATNLR